MADISNMVPTLSKAVSSFTSAWRSTQTRPLNNAEMPPNKPVVASTEHNNGLNIECLSRYAERPFFTIEVSILLVVTFVSLFIVYSVKLNSSKQFSDYRQRAKK